MPSRDFLWRVMFEAADAETATGHAADAAARIGLPDGFPPVEAYYKFPNWWTTDVIVPVTGESAQAIIGDVMIRADRLGDGWVVTGPELYDDGWIGAFYGVLNIGQPGRTECPGLTWALFETV